MSEVSYKHTAPKDQVAGIAEFAEDYERGDTIAFETPPDGEVLTAEVVGFSTMAKTCGVPVVEMPEELKDFYDHPTETLAIEAHYHAPATEVTPD